ncbi:MAG: 3'-phosphoesterase [Nitrospirae bacterium RBG_13_39_12]|nr:MAG: 3'-phosphoesterase [Nitrospirae bacterium RBG_13_39_12]
MPVFVIHEHHAKRLHFDLRLEIDKALKSWAIPKGPSMNPKEKRLAIMVEDHPLDYATFEGKIPEGMYGAGTVLIWDKGKFEITDGSLQQGKLDIVFYGKNLKGAFALAKMYGKDKEWLLIKKKDKYADYKFVLENVLKVR